jgi:hypothetical protein
LLIQRRQPNPTPSQLRAILRARNKTRERDSAPKKWRRSGQKTTAVATNARVAEREPTGKETLEAETNSTGTLGKTTSAHESDIAQTPERELEKNDLDGAGAVEAAAETADERVDNAKARIVEAAVEIAEETTDDEREPTTRVIQRRQQEETLRLKDLEHPHRHPDNVAG